MPRTTKENINTRKPNKGAYHKFQLLVRKNPTALFCFYEGKDAPYYYEKVKNYSKNNKPIKCGGKQKVIDIYCSLKKVKEYDKYKTAYFVDRDFDFSIKEKYPDIYETPCYSIENLYTSEEVLKNILENEFDLTEIDEEFTLIINIFKQRQKEFHEAVLLFNAWYACLKEIVNEGKIESANVSLNDKFPRGFISVSLKKVSCYYDLDKINFTFPNAIKHEKEKLNKKIDFFKKSNKQKTFRGKYEIEFFANFLEFLVSDAIQNKKNRKYIKNGTSFRLDKSQILTLLSSYAETPECLIDYLKNFS